MIEHNQTAESLSTYAIGASGFAIASLADIAQTAQSITIIVACVVVLLRLVYDSIRLYRFIVNKG